MQILRGYRIFRHPAIDFLVCSAVVLILFTATLGHAKNNETFDFKVWIDDREIGQHTFEVDRNGGNSTVISKASMEVKVLFVRVFNYRHDARERWQGRCLLQLESGTESQGDTFTVAGTSTAELFIVRAEKNGENSVTESFSGCLSSYAYWDRTLLNKEMLINSQTGEIALAKITSLGDSKVPKSELSAPHYRLTTEEAVIDLWYDQRDKWIALQTQTGKRTLTYLSRAL